MKNILLKLSMILCTITVLLINISSCGFVSKYNMHDTSEISSIEIVQAFYNMETHEYFETNVVTITDHESFLEDLERIKTSRRYRGELFGITSPGLAVKFTYNNGDYEVFRHVDRSTYKAETQHFNPCADKGEYDKFEFYELLVKYMSLYLDLGDDPVFSYDLE